MTPRPAGDVVAGLASGLDRVQAALAARWPESTMEPSLDRIRALSHLLGDPQHAFTSIHITGTNGKTSTARMVDALLRAFGLRAGRYTSPHLQSVTERIALDGSPLDPAAFVAGYDEVSRYLPLVDAAQSHPLSFFEVLTGMAFAVFADAPVDVATVEVGLGGRWDATNVVDAPVAVITPIGLDHTRWLGATVAEIAAEKGGIVKAGAVAVLGPQPPDAERVLLAAATEVGASVLRAGRDFGVEARSVAVGGQQLTLTGQGGRYPGLFLPLHGSHQAGNAACALAAVEAFLGGAELDRAVVADAFAGVASPGRLEMIRRAPPVLLDGAHNPAAAVALVAALAEAFSYRRLVGVVGMLADKDVDGVLSVLEPVLDSLVVTASSSPRAMPVDELAAHAVDVFGAHRVEVAARLDDALEAALATAEQDGAFGGGGVLVTGSIVTVGEARTLLQGRPS